MHPSLETVCQLYQATDNLYQQAVAGLDAEMALRRPGDQSNSVAWIAGHLAWTRSRLCGLLGAPVDFAWSDVFARGARPPDATALPPLDEVRQAWQAVSARLMKRLDELTEAELAAPAARPMPIADRSVRGAIVFLAYHEGYHIGQLSFLRKWMGLPGLVDG